jgi:hypothetical protein
MNPILQQMLTPSNIIACGAGFVSVGLPIWFCPRLARKQLEFRRAYAAALREKGEEIRARKVDALTEAFVKRTPIYGRIIVALGILMIVYAVGIGRK